MELDLVCHHIGVSGVQKVNTRTTKMVKMTVSIFLFLNLIPILSAILCLCINREIPVIRQDCEKWRKAEVYWGLDFAETWSRPPVLLHL